MASESLRRLLQLDRASLADGSLLLSLHPDGSRLAAARGQTVCICPLLSVTTTQPDEPGRVEEGADRAQELHKGQQQELEALKARRESHAAAGPRGRAEPGTAPLRYACPAASGPAAVSPDDVTALAWLAFARPPTSAAHPEGTRGRSSGGGAGGGSADSHSHGPRPAVERRRTNSSGGGGGVFASIQVMMEDHELQQQEQAAAAAAVPQHPHPGYSLVVLLSGTRGGALQLHDADSGVVLLRQQIHPGPVVSISVRTWRMGLNATEAVEDVTVGWADAVARLAAWELRAAATTCYAAEAAAEARSRAQGASVGGLARFGLWGSSSSSSAGGPTGPDIKPLAVQKWEVPAGVARGRSCVVCCGQRPRDLYSLLQGIDSSSPTASGKTIFLAGGNRPACLAALEVDEQSSGGGGALSYISSVATSVWGLARTARNVAAAPLSLRGGFKYLGMNTLQLVGGGGSSADASGGAAAPLASFPDPTAGQRVPSTGVWRQFRDDGRVVLSLAPAPHGSLVAAVDNLGRLLLVEVGAMIVSRMWKGYRDAQVAWMEVPVDTVAEFLERQRAKHRGQSQAQQEEQQQQQPQQQDVGQPVAQLSIERQPPYDGTGDALRASTDALRPGHAQGNASLGHGSEGAGTRGQRQTHESDAGNLKPTYASAGDAPKQAFVPQDMLLHRSQPGQQPGRNPRGTAVAAGGCGEHVLLLAVYAPRRQTLELWFPLQGERLAALAAPAKARLLQCGGGGSGGGELGTWRVADAASAAVPPMTPTRCMMCFAGTAPRLAMDIELDGGLAERVGDGLELLDVGAVFGFV